MFLTAASFVGRGRAAGAPRLRAKPHALWQAIPYLLLTAGEVMVSVTGLEFAYRQAPARMKSTIMSIWFLAIAAGNLLTALVSQLNRFQGAGYFALLRGAHARSRRSRSARVARSYRPARRGRRGPGRGTPSA